MADNSQGSAPARAQLTDLQSQYPPIYSLNSIGSDRPLALAGVLQEEFPPRLLELHHKDQLVIGEIGQHTPDIRTLPAGPDNFIIGVNSGLMDFYYAVGRAAHGRAINYVKSAIPENAPAINQKEMLELIASPAAARAVMFMNVRLRSGCSRATPAIQTARRRALEL